MKKEKVRAHCPRCRHQQIFVKATINHPLHLILALVTGGLWLVSWAALCIGKLMRPWRCEHCGWHKPEFTQQSAQPAPTAPAARPRKTPQPHPEIHPARLLGAQTSELRR